MTAGQTRGGPPPSRSPSTDQIAPQTMRVTVTVEFDHHTLGHVRLSKTTATALGLQRDIPTQYERLRNESGAVVQDQVEAITGGAS